MPFLLVLLLPLPFQPERGPSPPAHRARTGGKTPREVPPEREQAAQTAPDESWEEIVRLSRLHRVDPLLVRAVVEVESGHDPRARSPRGAIGLMQLMPVTLREMDVQDPWDRTENLEAGIRYLRRLLDRFDGDRVLALAAYNAGPRKVREHRGVPPFRETRKYVRRVLALYRKFQRERGEASRASRRGEEG